MLMVFRIARDIGLTLGLTATAPVTLPLKYLPIQDPVSAFATEYWDKGWDMLNSDLDLMSEKIGDKLVKK